jgi:resuscitation-promoting factor RpfB
MAIASPPTAPPKPESGVVPWIKNHKLASVVISIVALLVLAGAVGSSTEQATSSNSPPAPSRSPTSVRTNIAGQGAGSPSKQATVPQLIGLSFKDARSKLERVGLITTIDRKYSHERPGTVVTASAKAGRKASVGTNVVITIAQSYPTVPYVAGLPTATAISKLKAAGYAVALTKQESSQRIGTVISSNPSAGSDRLPGQKVVITVAKAPPAPSAEPSSGSCTPGYSPCLLPASDYDCAGGSGDGPQYVYGTVRVTGSDPYGLDSDNDGYGCE